MARVEDALGAQVLPRGRKVRKRDTPIGLFLVDMKFVAEVVDSIWQFGEIPFVILTFMVKRHLGVDAKKRREKVRQGRIGGSCLWFRNERWHIPSWGGFGGAVVKQDEVLWQGGRVNWNVHDGARPADGIVA